MPDSAPLAENPTDEINRKFLKRNNIFWGSLWKYLYSRGPKTLPFYTSFCLGSGKKQFRDGLHISNENWFNVMDQEYQPSVPSLFDYYFEDAYRGGSCIKFNNTVNNLRLFVSEFPCTNDVIVSFVFKRTDPLIQMKIILNLENEFSNKNILIYCKSDPLEHENVEAKSFERYLNPLNKRQMRYALIGLSNRQEKTFPSIAPINGWEARYYYLNFDQTATFGKIVDIGISVDKDEWKKNDSVLFGALHIHEGINNDNILSSDLRKITFEPESNEFEISREML